MKSRKGFTLVELLGAIVILSLLSLVAIPVVTNVVKGNKQKLYDIQIKNIESAAKAWGSDNLSSLPDSGESTTISLEQLQKAGYVEKDIKDPKTGKVLENIVVTICNINNQYTYTTDGKCDIPEESNTSLKSLTVNGKDVLATRQITLPIGTTSIEINATAVSSKATITGIGTKEVKEGKNNFSIIVTAEDESKTSYDIEVIITAASTNANLSKLGLTNCTLNPTFSSNTIKYTCTVDNSVTETVVSATASDSNATITGLGTKKLNVGTNQIDVVVTAQNSSIKKTYSIYVTRKKSNDATLKSLNVSGCTLSPTFSDSTTAYTCTVDNSVESVSVSATANNSKATVTGTGTKSLNVGENKINVKTTAEDGTTTKTYTVTVTRKEKAKSNDATLKSLSVNGKSINLVNNTIFNLELSNDTTNVAIEAITNDSNASVLMYLQPNGEKFSESNHTFSVSNGNLYIFAVVVIAEDSSTVKYYQINITVNSIFKYEKLENSKIKIIGFNDSENLSTDLKLDLIIPKTIFGNEVAEIGDEAFWGETLSSVTIPSSVKKIGTQAFWSADLESVNLSEGLEYIGEGCFGYNNLTSIKIPDSVTYIGSAVFHENLLSDSQAFTYARAGNKTLNPNWYGSDSDVTLVSFGGANKNAINIPNDVTRIANGADISLYNEIVIPDSVKYIDKGSFTVFNDNAIIKNYTNLAFDWYSAFDQESQSAFKGCPLGTKNIESCTVKVNYSNYSNYVYNVIIYDMNDIAPEDKFKYELDSSNNTAKITGFSDSYRNSEIYDTNLVIPSTLNVGGQEYTVTKIGSSSFMSSNLTSLTLPESVTYIGDYAFESNKLTSLPAVLDQSKFSVQVGAAAFNDNLLPDDEAFIHGSAPSYVVVSYGGEKHDDVTIPSNITYIGESAFVNNNLTSITIPESVTYIGENAFVNNNLTSITIPKSIKNIGQNAFSMNNLTQVTFNNTNNIDIASTTFLANNLEEITIPSTINTIYAQAFTANSLKSITFEGEPSLIENSFQSSIEDGAILNYKTVNSGLNYDTPYDNATSYQSLITHAFNLKVPETNYYGTLMQYCIPGTSPGGYTAYNGCLYFSDTGNSSKTKDLTVKFKNYYEYSHKGAGS